MTNTEILQFTGQEFIANILDRMPEAQEILLSHGLSCVGCHVNVYETLEQGCLGHGMSTQDLELILADLNDGAQMLGIPADYTPQNPIITEKARDQILYFQKEQNQLGSGFKIEVLDQAGDLSYFLDFLKKPEKGDRIVESLGIKLFLDPESLKKLQDTQIDFGENENGDTGFKIDKIPRNKKSDLH
jgi:hybrid cluster-associated redox disulfide protein